MDAASIFAKLKRGAKFDHKKHKNIPNQAETNKNSTITSSQSNDVTNNSSEKKRKREEREESFEDGSNQDDFLDNEDEQDDNSNSTSGNSNNNDNTKNHIDSESGTVRRKKNKIKVFGSDVPDPVTTFQELKDVYNVKSAIVKKLQESKYDKPTPIQMQAVPAMLMGREVIACAPTGSGKTMAFILPVLHLLKEPKKEGFRAIIVSPTRELATQIHREFTKIGGKFWKICLMTKATMNNYKISGQSAQNFDILVTTPMRLVHIVNSGTVKFTSVQLLIFDEADRLFDQGFLEQVDTIIAACPNPALKVSLFSATMLPAVEHLAKSIQKDPIKIIVGLKNTPTDTIDQKLVFVGNELGKLLYIRGMISEGKFHPPVLIFVQSKERAQQLFREFVYDGINVGVIHADRTQAQRDLTVEKFRTGEIWVLVTTDLMARGMDFKNVNLVINFDFPASITTYIHRIGRTGRAGKKGYAITFYTEADYVLLRSIANVMKASGCKDIPEWILGSLDKIDKRIRKMLEVNPVNRASVGPKGKGAEYLKYNKKKKSKKQKKEAKPDPQTEEQQGEDEIVDEDQPGEQENEEQ